MSDPNGYWAVLRQRFYRHRLWWVLGGTIAAAWSIFIWFFPGPQAFSNDPAILGRWQSQYQYLDSAGVVKLEGITELFENRTYSYVGKLSHTVMGKEEPFTAVYRLHGSGEWSGDNKVVLTKLTHLLAPLSVARSGDVEVSGAELKQMTGRTLSLADGVPMGLSERYEVVSLQDDRMVWRTQDLKGQPLIIEMLRTPMRSIGD
ncbi:hypothetical protein C4K14_4077 [Pseudomonas chlororaphis subsp. aureofaciens]|uniref:hypothetical protein n=1 Tax=Pseudomonas chlororaphis TaxID=587753 RepID=UPI000F56E066|nr:hypothetical protein [Pseudomonas chlororaphis]AZD86899.1 hypothetical protein C4K14_4077 [Pseudomonas chlororaphis subsp. aureofaciens]